MAEKNIEMYNDYFKTIENITFWIIPGAKETRIELVWQGSDFTKKIDSNHENLVLHINKVLELISEGTSDANIKQGLRDLQISKILD